MLIVRFVIIIRKIAAAVSQFKEKFFGRNIQVKKICAIYDCAVNDKSLKHCGGCEELPCHRYFDNMDPAYTKEEHIADTNRV